MEKAKAKIQRKRSLMKVNSKMRGLLHSNSGDKGFALVDSLLLLAILVIFIVVLVITFNSFSLPGKSQALSTSPYNIQVAVK